jgi:hypothetical protein
MKNLFITLAALFILSTTIHSCDDSSESGRTKLEITGQEPGLPPEIKGLKIYHVKTGNISYVKVGYLPGHSVISTTWPSGKTQATFILVTPNTNRTIQGEIISEADSIIVIKLK